MSYIGANSQGMIGVHTTDIIDSSTIRVAGHTIAEHDIVNDKVDIKNATLDISNTFSPFVGMIAAFSFQNVPTNWGWLVCNGADYESTDYPDLHNVITSTWVTAWTNGESITTGDFRKNSSGTIYIATSTGTTSGTDVGDDTGVTWSTTTKFLVPDLRGEFLRGFDNGTGNDPDAASRTGGDAVGSSQSYQIQSHKHEVRVAAFHYGSGTAYRALRLANTPQDYGIENTGGNETRPRNKNVQYCIKY